MSSHFRVFKLCGTKGCGSGSLSYNGFGVFQGNVLMIEGGLHKN